MQILDSWEINKISKCVSHQNRASERGEAYKTLCLIAANRPPRTCLGRSWCCAFLTIWRCALGRTDTVFLSAANEEACDRLEHFQRRNCPEWGSMESNIFTTDGSLMINNGAVLPHPQRQGPKVKPVRINLQSMPGLFHSPKMLLWCVVSRATRKYLTQKN